MTNLIHKNWYAYQVHAIRQELRQCKDDELSFVADLSEEGMEFLYGLFGRINEETRQELDRLINNRETEI